MFPMDVRRFAGKSCRPDWKHAKHVNCDLVTRAPNVAVCSPSKQLGKHPNVLKGDGPQNQSPTLETFPLISTIFPPTNQQGMGEAYFPARNFSPSTSIKKESGDEAACCALAWNGTAALGVLNESGTGSRAGCRVCEYETPKPTARPAMTA